LEGRKRKREKAEDEVEFCTNHDEAAAVIELGNLVTVIEPVVAFFCISGRLT